MDFIALNFKDSRWIIYMDSDSMVFKNLDDILLNNYDIILTPHNFSDNREKGLEAKVGKFCMILYCKINLFCVFILFQGSF